jgi:hypothetical protein
MKLNWKPSQGDTKWVSRLVDSLRDGGTWGTSAGIYRIDKVKKTLTLVLNYHNELSEELHDRNKKTFALIGYTVLELEHAEEKKASEAGEADSPGPAQTQA